MNNVKHEHSTRLQHVRIEINLELEYAEGTDKSQICDEMEIIM